MKSKILKTLGAVALGLLCIGCTQEFKEINPAYNPDIINGDIRYVEFMIPGFIDEGHDIQTKTTLTSQGFVWAEKDTVGIFPSKGNQIYYEMSSGAGSSSAVFDGGGWALKDEYIYSSYYPLKGDFYLDRKSIPVTYSTEVTQCGNNNSEHLGANAFMFAPETTVSNGKVTFKYWQLGCVLQPRVTLPAGTYTKLVLSTEFPIFVVSGKYDLTTGVDASSQSATMPDFVPVIVPDEDKSGNQKLTNCLAINLEDVTFATETELVAYIMAAPVDVSDIPITVTIYSGDSPKYRYEYIRASSFVAQTNHNIRPNEKGLMAVANTTESANAAFAAGETSLSLVDVEDNSVFNLVLPATTGPVNISMEANEGKCTMNVSYPDGQTLPEELNIIASNGSEIILNTPASTVTLDGDREYTSVRASTAPNTLIVNENITIGTLYLEKGNVKVYGEIMALNTDDLEEGEHPTLFVYGDIQGQIDDDDVIVRRPITAVSLDKSALELKPGDIVQLNFTTEPQNAIFENVTWSSSDGNVATVAEDGTVTAISAGECLITVDIDGKQAFCQLTVKSGGVDYIDLGLSVKWATCNIGASNPEEHGHYFAWGELYSKDLYNWSSYRWCNGTEYSLSKYCTNDRYGIQDNLTCLDYADDAAYVSSEGECIIPTVDNWKELFQNCDWLFTWQNGMKGLKGTSKIEGYKDKSIFLPASGVKIDDSSSEIGSAGLYWASSISDFDYPNYSDAICFVGTIISYQNYGRTRSWGLPIRPVKYEHTRGLSFNTTAISLSELESKKIIATTIPSNATNKKVIWHSDNPLVAEVDNDGLITGKSPGSATITATTIEGDYSAHCSVTVKAFILTPIDLGLSVKWANSNIGATAINEYGYFYAWGEVEPKSESDWVNYKWCNGTMYSITKYCTDNRYGTVDNKIVLEKEDDAASHILKGNWRIPTIEEFEELMDSQNCSWKWMTYNGINGYLVTSIKTHNSIFIPAEGTRGYYDNLEGEFGYYWSSTLEKYNPFYARHLYFSSKMIETGLNYRDYRFILQSIRPVCDE